MKKAAEIITARQHAQSFLCLFGGLMIAFAKEILTTIGAL